MPVYMVLEHPSLEHEARGGNCCTFLTESWCQMPRIYDKMRSKAYMIWPTRVAKRF